VGSIRTADHPRGQKIRGSVNYFILFLTRRNLLLVGPQGEHHRNTLNVQRLMGVSDTPFRELLDGADLAEPEEEEEEDAEERARTLLGRWCQMVPEWCQVFPAVLSNVP
jgi:hypothetical protein